jgi:enamine deaminase RidA (YjgF/YER057c/UK114 family)
MNRIVDTDTAPAAVGAYSQATETDDHVFTAGQIPLTPEGKLLDDTDELPKGVGVETEAVATK